MQELSKDEFVLCGDENKNNLENLLSFLPVFHSYSSDPISWFFFQGSILERPLDWKSENQAAQTASGMALKKSLKKSLREEIVANGETHVREYVHIMYSKNL